MSLLDMWLGGLLNNDCLRVARGHLDVRYDSPFGWGYVESRRDHGGQPCPFAYELNLSGTGRRGAAMHLRLCANALKPPQAVGGPVHNGKITVYGQPDTHSYYQRLGYSGTLRWQRVEERVNGEIGWLDRQWFPRYAGAYAGLLAGNYAHQWTQLSLHNGWDLSLWRQFDRRVQDRQIPFSGLTHTDPSGATGFTNDYTMEILSYVRDPGTVRPLLGPLQQLAGIRSSIRYFFDSFRLRVPSLELDIVSAPLVAASAHSMPIDYFSGPTRLAGTMQGAAIAGYGFHERTLPLSRPSQLIVVLSDSLLSLPARCVRRQDAHRRNGGELRIAGQAADRSSRVSPGETLSRSLRPSCLGVCLRTHRARLRQILDDLRNTLSIFR
jgi:hypothetical protein